MDRREQKFTQENKVIEIDNEDRFGQEERSERIVDVQSETTESVNKHSNKMQKEKFERNVEIERRGKEKLERKMEERKTVRQSSVKSLTEKFIKNASKYFELFFNLVNNYRKNNSVKNMKISSKVPNMKSVKNLRNKNIE